MAVLYMKTYVFLFQTKIVEKIQTHILCSITFFPENLAVYEIMWKNMAERGRQQMTIWRMRIACWIPEATDTHSEYAKPSECLLPRTGT
jgi:hypothetical protein